jgi:hypothetical protein
MEKVIVLFIASFALFNANSVHADGDWEIRKDQDNIQVFTRDVDGSPHDEVRATTVVQDVRLASLVALILDAQACPNWASRCGESYIFERPKETEAYVYTHSRMPFPVKDRDMLTHAVWNQDESSLIVTVNSQATNGIMDDIAGRQRMTEVKLSWKFEPLDSGAVAITNQAHFNPGSVLPGWITNMLLVSVPYDTMQSYVHEVAKPQYRDAVVGFVREPSGRN